MWCRALRLAVILAAAVPSAAGAAEFAARHGMTSGQYQAEFNKYVGQGYRLVHVSGYMGPGQALYAAIWSR